MLSIFTGLRLSKVIETAYLSDDYRADQRREDVALLTLLAMHHDEALRAMEQRTLRGLEEVLVPAEAAAFIGTNTHEGIVYYSKERSEELLDWLLFTAACTLAAAGGGVPARTAAADLAELLTHMRRLSESSRYRLREFIQKLHDAPAARPEIEDRENV